MISYFINYKIHRTTVRGQMQVYHQWKKGRWKALIMKREIQEIIPTKILRPLI